jgi:hypothetical protein
LKIAMPVLSALLISTVHASRTHQLCLNQSVFRRSFCPVLLHLMPAFRGVYFVSVWSGGIIGHANAGVHAGNAVSRGLPVLKVHAKVIPCYTP